MHITFDSARIVRDPLPGAAPSGADATLFVLDGDGQVLARCGLWWKSDLWHGKRRVGRIGAYAATGDAAAVVLLDAARQRLRLEGCAVAVGPMDGSTWGRYRFALDEGAPPFLLEPTQPGRYVRQWRRAGFHEAATYRSTEGSARACGDSAHAPRRGLRTLDVSHLDEELARLHRLSLRAFAHAPFFTPIDEAAFVAQHRLLLPHVDPELVLLAEDGDRLVAAAFALPDRLETPVQTVVLKTLAVDPCWFGHGLGRWLAGEVERRSAERGYRRVIHALMHEDNPSTRLRDDHRVRRRYALYASDLA